MTVHCSPGKQSNNSNYLSNYLTENEAVSLLRHILPQEQQLPADVHTAGHMLLAWLCWEP